MFFHQPHNTIGGDIYNAYVYHGLKWLTHLHKGFELTVALDGIIEAEVGGNAYALKPGDAVLLTPYQLHSYNSASDTLAFVAVFSGNYVQSFARMTAGREAENPVMTLSAEARAYINKYMLFSETEKGLYSRDEVVAIAKPDALTLKACLYVVCAEFYSRTKFLERTRDNTLASDILSYIENNYASDISLKTMADSLGYDFRYISRIFGKTFEINLKTLVNQYRCDRAKSLISSTDDTLSEIAMNSGFQSIRSFNRVFRELTGNAPSELRK